MIIFGLLEKKNGETELTFIMIMIIVLHTFLSFPAGSIFGGLDSNINGADY